MGNRERILEASLELFNEHGSRAITTNHIAAHLEISPGNLYYHFRNKEEIIRGIYPRIDALARAALLLPEGRDVSAEDVGRYHLVGIETLWNFRFILRDLSELLARDPALAESYRDLQRWLIGQLQALFDHLIAQGHMHPPREPDDLARVATNAFILWTSWVNFLTTSRPEQQVHPRDMLDGALQSFMTFEPFLEPDFAAEVRRVLRKRVRG